MEFTTFEIEKFKGYSYISKYILRDRTLSLKAKGLLALSFSLPDDWKYTEAGLAAINKDGIDAIKSVVKELQEKEYLVISRVRNEDGRFGDSCFKFYQMPFSISRDEFIEPEFSEIPTDDETTNVFIEELPVSIMSNYHLRDCNLSLRAKGLLTLMFSLPPNWIFSEEGLTKLSSDGLSSVRSAIKELVTMKYVTHERKRDEKGHLGKAVYTIYRMPYDIDRKIICEESVTPEVENPTLENPLLVNPPVEKPLLDSPLLENPPQLKTNISNTNLINTNSQNNKQEDKTKVYGKHKNVLLSLSEYEKIISLYSGRGSDAIEIASENIKNGTKCGNTFRYIMGIIDKMPDEKINEPKTNTSLPSYDLDLFKDKAMNKRLRYHRKEN